MLHFDTAQVLSLVIGTVLPLLVGLVTRSSASPGLRAVTLAVLSAVSAFLAEWLHTVNAGTPFDVASTVLAVLGTFLVAVGTHFGFWQATGISDKVKAVGGFIGPR